MCNEIQFADGNVFVQMCRKHEINKRKNFNTSALNLLCARGHWNQFLHIQFIIFQSKNVHCWTVAFPKDCPNDRKVLCLHIMLLKYADDSRQAATLVGARLS